MVAKGCGYEGENDPLEGEGKLMWKGEWAAQWARWRVASEGAGKEYVVPSSAWWVNGEIAERILNFPMPVPIFYEHLMINGKKMSASLGNVVYPHDWLEVAPAELLRFFYNKKLMKTRSFSWRDLPNLYDEYDRYARVHFGEEMVENEREARHMKRLYEISQLDGISRPISLPFSHAAMVSQIFIDDSAIIESLKRSKHYEKEKHDLIMARIKLARNWANKYAPVESRVTLLKDCSEIKKRLSSKQKTLLLELAKWLEKERTPNEIHNQIYNIANKTKLPLNKAFQAIYLSLLGATRGPKAGAFIASLDRQWAIQRFKEVS
jgi:lysyl-tRNA synthetase class 1